MAPKRKANAASLTVDVLASDGQFRALAALVVAGGPNGSAVPLEALAGSAGVDGALEWLLVLDLTEPQWAAVAAALPTTIPLPQPLTGTFRTLVNDAVTAPNTLKSAAVAKLVGALPHEPARLTAARAILKDGLPTGVLHDAAAAVLAAAGTDRDRPALVRDATDAAVTLADRVLRVDALGDPRSGRETQLAQDLLDEVRAAHAGVDSAAVGRIASRLPQPWVSDWVHSSWPYGLNRVLTEDFAKAAGTDRMAALVRTGMPPDRAAAIYLAAYGLDWPGDIAVGALLVKHGHTLPDQAARYLKNGDTTSVREGAWQIVLDDPGTSLVAAFAGAASPDSLRDAAERHAEHPAAPERLGQVAAQTIMAHSDADPADHRRIPRQDWVDMVVSLTSMLGHAFLRGVAASAGNANLSGPVLDLAVSDDETLHAFIDAGHASDIVAAATTPQRALSLLSVAADKLGSHVEALLDTVGTNDVGRWVQALRLVAATEHADVVRYWAVVMGEASLDEVEGNRPDPVLAAATIREALACGLASEPARAKFGVALLREARPPDLASVGARWVADTIAETDDLAELVDAAVHADDHRGDNLQPILDLRHALAEALIATAEDTTEPSPRRAHALDLALKAAPSLARAAALRLGGSNATEVNLAAATILAGTPGTPEETERLQELHDKETSKPVKALYAQALQRVTVHGAVTALERILDLTEQHDVPASVLHEVAPADDTDRAARLVHAITEVLKSGIPSASPRTFLTECAALADELMGDAIIAADNAGVTMKSAQADRLRARQVNNHGSIARNQAVLDTFPWVVYVGVLHNLRAAHATKIGETKPTVTTEKDRLEARLAIGHVVVGWVKAMQEYPPQAG